MFGRRINMHDQIHALDIDTARGNIGGHEYRGGPVSEFADRPSAGTLTLITVDADRRGTVAHQLFYLPVDRVLGAHEHDGFRRCTSEIEDNIIA